jgi:putative lipoic acid-binding regulatory protein
MKKDYTQLQALLDKQETFPITFTYKFIGHHTPAFAEAVAGLERLFPELRHELSRESSGGKHLAKTYLFEARDSDAIIAVYRAIEGLKDLVIVL